MVGIFGSYATAYLWTVMVVTLLLFCLPILLAPLAWAKRIGWSLPADTHLTVYFGRCLGALILVFQYALFRAIFNQEIRPFVFDLALGVSSLMVAVHAYGAVRKTQPLVETLEIGFYSLLFILTVLFYPVG